MKQDMLLLIDGSSLLTTQFFGNLPREILFAKTDEEKEKYFHKIMMTRTGVYTNAVYGFLRTLFKMIREQEPSHIAVSWDLTRDTFRRELYPDYKGNRKDTMVPLSEQFDLCQKVLERIGISQFSSMTYEADDYCGSLAAKFENDIPVRIMTKDHDYLQLVTEKTHLWLMHSSVEKTDEMYQKYHMQKDTKKVPERCFELDPQLVLKEFGVKPENINSLKGIQGDSSDNIKGVPGVGPLTAVKLIAHYGTVDALYNEISGLDKKGQDAIKKYWKEELGITRSPLNFLLKTSEEELVGEASARLSEKLATIVKDIPLPDVTLDSLKLSISSEETEKVLDELEFASLKKEWKDSSRPQINYTEKFTDVEDLFALSGLYETLKKEKYLGVDYEPSIGLSIAIPDGTTYYVPIRFLLTDEAVTDMLSKLNGTGIRLYSTDGKKLIKNSSTETYDISVAAYLLSPLDADYPYEKIAEGTLHQSFPSREALIGKADLKKAFESDENAVRLLLCYRALTSVLAGPELMKKLSEEGMLSLYEKIELPLMGALSRMESAGILVREDELKAYGEALSGRISELENKIYEEAGETFNINSPKQLGVVLFEHMNLPYPKSRKSGYSTSADILEKLKDDYPLVSDILEYRTYTKLRSTYAEGLREWISEDGRIHGSFNQTITATGRISSTNPNLQNIPARIELGRLIRKVFVPEDGCIFIDADYSQIELRILAHLSGDENLIGAYQSAKDIHAITASQVFHVPLSEVTPLQRRNAKAVNFGIVYGISAFGLGEDLSISRDEANEYMRRYFESYPKIESYLKNCVEEAREKGYVTTMYGRKRPIPELLSSNFNQRSFGERVAMNSPIQGAAADIMKIAMINVENRLKAEGMRSRIVLQVHDELLVETFIEEADQVEKILTEEMEQAADLRVKLIAEAKRGSSWYETK